MLFRAEKPDGEVIAAVLNGDKEEFSVLVRRYQDRIIGFCFTMLGEKEAARDGAQETFIKAFKGLGNFHGKSSFSTWLYKIAYNHCCSMRRRRTAARTESLDAMSVQARENAEKLLSHSGTAPDDDSAKLASLALNALPPAYRAVISLRLQGEEYKSIAAALGISVDSVKARLRRARAILRIKLRHFLPESASTRTGARK
jgi:RNA polymerase sigma-70 factor (ECF subfamily)